MLLHSKINTQVRQAPKISLRNFFVPTRHERAHFNTGKTRVCAIIPTYRPGELTLSLVLRLAQWNPEVRVCVVDDSTPPEFTESVRILERIASLPGRITMLRTPFNALKAGALNHALEHIFADTRERIPDVIVTLDDDVVITPMTVKLLVAELMVRDDLGAVCSQCHVLNKNKNLLTRLQGLEYLGFNATRLADEGFFRGPLVMHGMLTAFRASALRDAGGFNEGHLIEDYEVTARLKARGWSVKSVVNSHAWTVVPENFSTLWRQRARWLYGGITVVDKITYLPAVVQDVIGHGVFWMIVLVIDLLIVTAVFGGTSHVSSWIPDAIILVSLAQLVIWYVFQLWLMRLYKEKDRYDWLIRISLIPEFLYANVLTVVLIGSYFFLFFNVLTSAVKKRGDSAAGRLAACGGALFRMCGYTERWGTRT